MTIEEAKKILERIVNTSNELTHPVILNTEMGAIKMAIEALQVQKTGKWIGDKCSVCGKGIDDLIESSEWYQNESPRYCPFCGIKIQPSKAESEE